MRAFNKQKELEDELRLMYVAATRAKENLFFIYPRQVYDKISGMILSSPSCFIDDMPDDMLAEYSADI